MATQPKLTAFQSFFWKAFKVLQSERPASYSGYRSIPFTAMLRYAEYLELMPSETTELIRVITAVDDHYVGTMNDKQAKASSK